MLVLLTSARHAVLFSLLSVAVAAGVIDNSAQASSLAAAALALDNGNYTFREYSRDLYLSFVGEGNGVIPDGNSSWAWAVGQMEDDRDGHVNGTGVLLTSDKKRTLQANNAGDPKCLAAQWGAEIGADHAGVMYSCKSAVSGTLRKAKLLWLFVPSTTVNATCGEPSVDHARCVGVCSIVALDHLLDQPARALSANGTAMRLDYGNHPEGVQMSAWQDDISFLWEVWAF